MPRGVSVYNEAVLQGRLWSPNAIAPSLVVWFDADDLSTITTATGVSEWKDKSGNNRHLSQAVGSQQPELQIQVENGRNSIKFNKSSSQFLSMTNFPSIGLTGGLGVFFVGRWLSIAGASAADIQVIMENDGRFIIQDRTDIATDPFQVAHLPTGGNGAQVSPGIGDNVAKVIGGVMVTGTDTIFVNGTQRGSGSNPTSFATSATLRVGTWVGLSRYFNGSLSEIVMTGNTTEIARQRIEGYLSWKWGLQSSLLPTHPFYNRPPLIGD